MNNSSMKKTSIFAYLIIALGFSSCFLEVPVTISFPEVEPYHQSDGVQGGELIKTVGESLVILRKGLLYSVKKNKNTLRTISSVNMDTYGIVPGLLRRRLFVVDERIVVVGLDNVLSAVVVGLFNLDKNGRIIHLSTNYLSGCQFYINGKNAVSRVIDDKLIFYVPVHVRGYTDKNSPICQFKSPMNSPGPLMIGRWQKRSKIRWKKTNESDKYENDLVGNDSIHSIYYCSIYKDTLSCKTKSVRGGFARDLYVSNNGVYLWTLENRCLKHDGTYGATVYRFPINFDSKEGVKIWKTFGTPVNKYSVREIAGTLHAVVQKVRCSLNLETIISTNTGSGDIYLVNRSIDKFVKKNESSIAYSTSSLYLPSMPGVTSFRSRFIGSQYIYGYQRRNQPSDRLVKIVNVENKKINSLAINHTIDSIFRVDKNSFLVQGKSYDTRSGLYQHSVINSTIQISSVSIAEKPNLMSNYKYSPSMNSETHSVCSSIRKVDLPDIYNKKTKIVALPIQQILGEFSHLKYGSARVLFLSVGDKLELSMVGVISAHEQKNPIVPHNTGFELFYENTSPIVVNGKILTVLGNEIAVLKEKDKKLQKVSFSIYE